MPHSYHYACMSNTDDKKPKTIRLEVRPGFSSCKDFKAMGVQDAAKSIQSIPL